MVPDTCSYPFFQGIAPQTGATCTDYWIGAFRTPPSTGYMTLKGSPIPDNFKFWGAGQPSRLTQACVQMADELGYAMNDDNCGELAGYICQKFI
ncbi:hypothetical protein CHS0354_028705 [Potamilus streckersoni]|nr:hypothetical protein CHS0354_028705 [Potamilus streckersoni]